MRGGTKRLCVSAALVALTVVLLFLGSLVEVLDLVTVTAASFFVAFALIEFGALRALAVYVASSVLALLLVPKTVSCEYALIVGALPLLKWVFEKLPRPLALLCKFLSFNLLFSAVLFVFARLFGIPLTEVSVFGHPVPPFAVFIALYLAGNLCFLLYDILMTRLAAFYCLRYHARVARKLK